ncbi:Smr/MutS family protein [Limnobacter humi]|uniref:Smr/MutS family protein n=1 Tax=Limnobacter humi TaxID=1778671 RepID=A0ABT1WEZ9_9BURK|nr:Smr/MutS family protein [Limnobacter humi]MCQ8896060.1 Smr/MutS family protein [Limnobacter humi]
MKKLNSMADLEGVRRLLKDQRLEAERQEKLRLEAERKQREEAQLFQRQVQDVTPLPNSNRKVHDPNKPPPIARQRELDDAHVLQESISDDMDVERFLETDDKLSYRRNGIGLEALKRLRSGKWVIQAQIDLHGYRTEEAREAVGEFLRTCVKHDVRCVRIIHGKGLGSVGKEPVLKDKVKRWLVQKDEVLAFCQAPPRDGGAGALLVILKAKH